MIVQPISFWNGAPPDPLAGIPLIIRLQNKANAGNNAALGMFKDTTMLVPATADGDLVNAWASQFGVAYNVTSTSGGPATLKFIGGVPTVLGDGVLSGLLGPVMITDSITIVCQVKVMGNGVVWCNGSGNGDGVLAFISGGSRDLLLGGGSNTDGPITSNYETWTIRRQPGQSATWAVNGTVVVTQLGDAWTTPTITDLFAMFRNNTPDNFSAASFCGLWGSNTFLSDADVLKIETYAASLSA